MQMRVLLCKTSLLVAVVGALAIAGCGRHDAPPPAGNPAVSVITVTPRSLTLETTLSGRTMPYRVAELRPRVNGIIETRLFEEGAEVTEGQTLYIIDPSPYEAALQSAQAALARAEADKAAIELRKERFEALLPDKAVSQQDYDDAASGLLQAEAAVAAAKAQVRSAQINLDYTRVEAPISGRIGRSSVTEGAVVTAYQPMAMATIHQLDPIYVFIATATTEMLALRHRIDEGGLHRDGATADQVRLVQEDGREYPLSGSLQFRDVSVDPSTGSIILRAVFPNPDGLLLPAMFVRAEVIEGIDDQALLIPQECVVRDSRGLPYVWVVGDDSKAGTRSLVLDRAVGSEWLVSEGLTAGESVVIEGLQSLRQSGTPVDATAYAPEESGAAPGEQSTQQTAQAQ